MGYPEVPRAALKSLRAIPNPRPADRRPKETRNSELPQITQMGADNQAGRPAGRRRHGLFPIGEYRRHRRLRHSDFGLRASAFFRVSGFGLRI